MRGPDPATDHAKSTAYRGCIGIAAPDCSVVAVSGAITEGPQ